MPCSFETLVDFSAVTFFEHEQLISRMPDVAAAQDLYFPDFPGVVKKPGRLGRDFVLASERAGPGFGSGLFFEKGFSTCLAYQDMVVASGR
ncbi:MAG: hypothetical protein R3D58_11490 [Saprospiraceae bacterium]